MLQHYFSKIKEVIAVQQAVNVMNRPHLQADLSMMSIIIALPTMEV